MPSAEKVCGWEDLPILPGTQFCLELALRRDPPDLGEFTVILRTDPVAVLHLFALVGNASVPSEDQPRLEDLILTLGRDDLLRAFCRQTPARGAERRAALAFAKDARLFGQMCRTVAETTGLPGEQAYVVGLLHDIERLPRQLGRRAYSENPGAHGGPVFDVARRYALPHWLQEALQEIQREDAASPWTAIVHAAYELLAVSRAGLRPRTPSDIPARDEGRKSLFLEIAESQASQAGCLLPQCFPIGVMSRTKPGKDCRGSGTRIAHVNPRGRYG